MDFLINVITISGQFIMSNVEMTSNMFISNGEAIIATTDLRSKASIISNIRHGF